MTVNNFDVNPKGPSADLMIDSSIQNKDISHLKGRSLEMVSNAWLEPSTLTSLEGDSLTKGAEWNQFETNKRLFNVQSTYDENLYTKKLDTTKISKEKLAEAERIAREIEGSASTNVHIQEERGHALQREIDEEDLYSGVIRDPSSVAKQSAESDVSPWKRILQKPPSGKMTSSVGEWPRDQSKSQGATPKAVVKSPQNSNVPRKGPTSQGNLENNQFSRTSTPGAPSSPVAPLSSLEGPPGFTPVSEKEKFMEVRPIIDELSDVCISDEGKSSESLANVTVVEVGAAVGKEVEKSTVDSITETPVSSVPKPSSKLNPNAPEFSFNPKAPSFTPGQTFQHNPAVHQNMMSPPMIFAPHFDQGIVPNPMQFGNPIPQQQMFHPSMMSHPGQMDNPEFAFAASRQPPPFVQPQLSNAFYPGMPPTMIVGGMYPPQGYQQPFPGVPGHISSFGLNLPGSPMPQPPIPMPMGSFVSPNRVSPGLGGVDSARGR